MNGDMSHLDKLLDAIDSKKMKFGSTDVQNAPNLVDPLEIYAWKKYFNPESNKYYYYNHKTNVSQWEKPDNFIEYPHSHSSDLISNQAVFNYNDSNFSLSGNKSYWEAVGRPNDREGRQLSAFFDLDSFDKNRELAAEMKKNRQLGKDKKMKSIDWTKYKEDKKKKKFAKLFQDDV